VAWLSLSLRRLRDARQASIAVVVLVLVTAAVFGLGPRLLDRLANDVLRSDVGDAPSDQRNLQLIEDTRIAPGGRPFEIVDDNGGLFESQFPDELDRLVVGRSALIDTSRFRGASRPLPEATVRLRFQPDALPRLQLVEGRFPAASTMQVPSAVDDPAAPRTVLELEVAMPVVSAAALGMKVGDELTVRSDPTDRLSAATDRFLAIKLVGTIRPIDPQDPAWFNDPSLEHFALRSPSPLVQIQDVTALASTDAYPALFGETAGEFAITPFRYTWRYTVDPALLDARRADGLLADLRRMESVFPAAGGRTAGESPTLQSALLRIVGDYVTRWHSVVAVLAVVATGPAGVALAALGFVCSLAAGRRRPSLALTRARGGSVGQLFVSAAAEGALLAVPAGGAGVAVAIAIQPSPNVGASIAIGILVVGAAIVMLVGAAWPRAVDVTRPARPIRPSRGRAIRRLVVEGVVIGLAVLGVVLLRQRGVEAASAAGDLAGPDPLLAAVPILVAAAVGVLAVRIFPIPMRLAGFVASTRRDLVPFIAMRRLTHGGATRVLLVLLAAAAVGVFTATALLHVDEAADAIAWRATGAPFRIVGPTVGALDPSGLPGAQAAVLIAERRATIDPRGTPLVVVTTAPTSYRGVVSSSPIEPVLGPAFDAPVADPIPAIASPSFAATNGLAIGDHFVLNLNSTRRTFEISDIGQPIPTVSGGDSTIVVSQAQLAAAVPSLTFPPSEMLVRAPDSSLPAIRSVVSRAAVGSTVESRADDADRVRSSPVVIAVRLGIAAAMAVAAIYAALAVAAAMALSGASRAVEAAGLRTLGLSRRQAVALVAAEHGPTLAFALIVGVPTGLIAFSILRPGLGLAAIVGSPVDVPIHVDAILLAAAAGLVALVVSLATILGAALQADIVAATAIRREAE
jgi:putative ABC transport system permease protein